MLATYQKALWLNMRCARNRVATPELAPPPQGNPVAGNLPMSTQFTFGEAPACRVSLDDYTLLAPDAANYPPLDNPADAVREALAHPLSFPPLAAATAPGDHVAVAL